MSNSKHDFTKTEIMAGALVLSSVAVLAAFIAVIHGWRPPQEVHTYYANFTNIGGLNVNADVRFGGVIAGRVQAIEPHPENATLIQVALNLQPDIPVNRDSVATVDQVSLTSPSHLEVSTGSVQAPRLVEGDIIAAVTKSGGLVDLPDLSGVIARVERLLDDVLEILGAEEARQLDAQGEREFIKVTRIAAQLNATLEEGVGLVGDVREAVNEQRPNIEAILQQVQDIEHSAKRLVDEIYVVVAENREPIREGIAGAQNLLDDLNVILDGVTDRLDALLASLEMGLDNAAQMSDNTRDMLERNRPVVEDVILDLRDTVRYLKDFSRTLAEQPQSVIRGRTPEGRRN